MESFFAVKFSYLIPLFPLIGAMVAGFAGARWLKQSSHWPIWIGVGLRALLSLVLLFGMLGHSPCESQTRRGGIVREGAATGLKISNEEQKYPLAINHDWYSWISTGDFHVQAGAFIDPLTAVMLCVVCGIGLLITIFSAGYMKGEEGYFRFFAYLGLFIFAMTILVMANNFVLLYLGW